jgi:hypothetical protein
MRGHTRLLPALILLTTSGLAAGEDSLWSIPHPPGRFYTTSYSNVFSQPYATDEEVADDFQATGLIQRLHVPGYGCGASCGTLQVSGVFVRVYEWTSSGPGPLQHERYVTASSGDFTWDGSEPYTLFINIADPIPVDGWHFISVQVAFGSTGGVWQFKQANRSNYINMPVQYRNNLTGGVWAQDRFFSTPIDADVVISIYGQAGATQPVVTSISRTSVTPSDRIIVTGSGFGAPGGGQLLVNGLPGIVTNWSSTEIIGYVPEGVEPGAAELTVVNLGVASDPMPITIVPRSLNGRVRWVFEGDGNYTTFAPGIGPDGTIYFDDIDGNLYAVTGDCGLLWIVDALLGLQGNANEGPVSVGDDGTIYVGTNPLGPTVEVVAFNPDGSHKWTFTAPEALTWVAGPDVGPDGRIYGALNGAQLYGQIYDVVALNPDGSVAWTSAADPLVFEDAARGFEMAFAPSTPGGPIDQLLFTADLYSVQTFGRVWGFDLADGSQNFATVMNPAGPGTTLGNCQLAANPVTGAFYGTEFNGIGGAGYGLHAFDSSGNRLWRFDPNISSDVTAPAVGPDGTIYFGWDLGRLTAVSPNGNEIWTNFEPVIYNGPMPSPTEPILFAIAREGYSEPSFMEARDATNGQLLWSQSLVDDEGIDVGVYTRPRFAPDGQSAYFAALEQPITPTSTYRVFAVDTSSMAASALGDLNRDGVVDHVDHAVFFNCITGPGGDMQSGCEGTDLDGDLDTDMADFARFTMAFTE